MSITPHCRIDVHVHLTGPDALASLRLAGVSAVRDAGTKNSAGLSLQGPSSGTFIQSAGRALFRKGGYGGMFGKGFETAEEIKEEIRTLANSGAGIIKVMASGIVSLTDPGTITAGGFGADELRMIVNEARKQGLNVMAHANGEEAIVNAACAGVRSIEHGFFMTDRALAGLTKAGTWWVPTIGALERAAAGAKISADVKHTIDEIITQHLAMIRKAHEQGVKLAIGTDVVLPEPLYREYYEAELEYFRRMGIPGEEVEWIACESGKELLGLKGSEG